MSIQATLILQQTGQSKLSRNILEDWKELTYASTY